MRILASIFAAIILACLAPSVAEAQCNGQFPAGTICGNPTGAQTTPRQGLPSAFGIPTLSANNTWTGTNTYLSLLTMPGIAEPITGLWWSNYPTTAAGTAPSNNIYPRTFFGAAAENDNTFHQFGCVGCSASGFTDLDPLGRLNRVSYNGGDGIGVAGGNDGNFSLVYAFPRSDIAPCILAAPCITMTLGSQNINSLAGATNRALNLYSVNNTALAANVPIWTIYGECHRVGATTGNTYCLELDGRNSVSAVTNWNPYSAAGAGTVLAALGAGAGLSATGQFPITAGMYFTANPMDMGAGILFFSGSIGPYGNSGTHPAIMLPENYTIEWWKSGSRTALINSDTSGNLNLTVGGGNVLAVGGGIGYGAGSGGTVTQGTSKTTGVTLNTVVGQIVMNNSSLADSTNAAFTLTNSAIAANDGLAVWVKSGGTANVYAIWTGSVSAGSAAIVVRNVSGGTLAEAITIGFAVIKGSIN